MTPYYCHKCGKPWESDRSQPAFKEVCGGCGAYLHCCKNCRFHRLSAHNQCYIPNTEYVANRTGLNFCEEFSFREGKPGVGADGEKQQKARESFSGLFGDQVEPEGKPSFDDLFKD